MGARTKAWWETRLLVLLAGAVRHKKPDKVVFVGKEANMDRRFQVSRGTAPKVLLASCSAQQ